MIDGEEEEEDKEEDPACEYLIPEEQHTAVTLGMPVVLGNLWRYVLRNSVTFL